MRSAVRWMIPAAIALLAFSCSGAPPAGKARRNPVGVGISMGHSLMFADAAKNLRAWEPTVQGSGPVPLDEKGWPLSDARTVFFDHRPIPAWAPPLDDPEAYAIDVSGTYRLSFAGQARISNGADAAGEQFSILNQRWDAASNRTTAELALRPGKALMIVDFTETKRLPGDAPGTGIADVKLIRPGYDPDAPPLFSAPFLAALGSAPFAALRFMGYRRTNDSDPAYPATVAWEDRKKPDDATQEPWGSKRDGGAWEYAIALANETGMDPWFNVPAAADDGYIRGLAELCRDTLDPALSIYLEYSNEVWNPLFSQFRYNSAAAVEEIRAGRSNLDDTAYGDRDIWIARRYAKRTVEIGRIFAEVYGASAAKGKIRPVLSWWTMRVFLIIEMLDWIERNCGPAADQIYGIAVAPYMNVEGASDKAAPTELLAAMRKSSDGSVGGRRRLVETARKYGVKALAYEGGPDTGGGHTENVGNRIQLERLPEMRALILRDIVDNWFALGGDLFMMLELTGYYSRYGSWGLTDDTAKPDRNAKFQGVRDAIAQPYKIEAVR